MSNVLKVLLSNVSKTLSMYFKKDFSDPDKAHIGSAAVKETKMLLELKNSELNYEKFEFEKQIKAKQLENELEKIELEKRSKEIQFGLESEKFKLEKIKVRNQKRNDDQKIDLDIEKFEFEKSKFALEEERIKSQIKVEWAKMDLEELKLDIENKKLDYQSNNDKIKIELEKLKLDIEASRLEIEGKRIKLEEEKLADDRLHFAQELNSKKRSELLTTTLRILEVVIPVAVYSAFMLMNFRLIYKDDGRITSEMKETWRLIFSKK